MPRKSGKSLILAKMEKYGIKAAVEAHREDETTLTGVTELPPGIESGIARLIDCRFGEFATGKLKDEVFFFTSGVVIEPKESKGEDGKMMKVEGLRMSRTEPMCPSPDRSRATSEEHIQWTLNEIRKLGLITKDCTSNDLEDLAAVLKGQKPFFKFRTWKGEPTQQFPNPRTQVNWNGVIDYVPSEDGAAAIMDATEGEDLDGIVAMADGNDIPSQEKLEELAREAGITEETVKGAGSWAEVAIMVREADKGGTLSPAPEADEPPPFSESYEELAVNADDDDENAEAILTAAAEKAGIDHDLYKTWVEVAVLLEDKATAAVETRKPKKGESCFYEGVEVEVTAVFPGKQLCNVKSVVDKKSWKSIPWADLSEEG